MTTYTIDTCVLAWASDPQSPGFFEAVGFLSQVHKGHGVAVDSQQAIVREYRPYICPESPKTKGYAAVWWAKMRNRVHYVSGDVCNRLQSKLINKLAFHSNDLKFVGVASHTSDKLLVIGEDRGYTPSVKACLCQDIGIHVICCADRYSPPSSPAAPVRTRPVKRRRQR